MRIRTLFLAAAAVAVLIGPAFAEQGDWLLRVRAIAVLPEVSATIKPIGGNVKVNDSVVPEVDATYFFTDNWSVEVIAGTTRHSSLHTPSGTKLGSVWLLPPTATAQYHFNPEGGIRPYLGAGVNYTVFYNASAPAGLNVKYQNQFGWALQGGVDIPVGDGRYLLNLDLKKLFLSTNVNINSGLIRANVDLNPWIAGVGVGFKI